MSKHEFFDKLVSGMGGLYGESTKFFNRSIESYGIKESIDGVRVPELPDFFRETEIDVPAEWNGRSMPTRFKVIRWLGSGYPCLIFHHGSGDQPYYMRIEKILKPYPGLQECSIIATDSPFNTNRKAYMHAIGDLQDFVLIFAVSTVLIESILSRLKEQNPLHTIVSGISLGGWITNLHHTYFNTADEYRPIFAGAAPEELFLNSAYSKLASQRLHNNPESVRKVLNFEDDFKKAGGRNVFPLLGKYDQYIRFTRQKGIYCSNNISVAEKGHITGSADNKSLQKHLIV